MKTQQKNSSFTLKPSEISKLLLNAGSFRNRCIIKLLCYVALRRMEVAKMRIEDLDFERNRIKVVGKGNKLAILPVLPEVMDDLKHLIGDKNNGYIFYSPKNPETYIDISQINRLVAKAGEKAGLTNPNPKIIHINPHILRHSAARIWKNKGMPLETVQILLRHSSIKTTMDMYGTKDADAVQKDLEELGKW